MPTEKHYNEYKEAKKEYDRLESMEKESEFYKKLNKEEKNKYDEYLKKGYSKDDIENTLMYKTQEDRMKESGIEFANDGKEDFDSMYNRIQKQHDEAKIRNKDMAEQVSKNPNPNPIYESKRPEQLRQGQYVIQTQNEGEFEGKTWKTKQLTQYGKVAGEVNYEVKNDEVKVNMIKVYDEFKRQGVATKLLQNLQREVGDKDINFDMLTPDGEKLMKKIGIMSESKKGAWGVNHYKGKILNDFSIKERKTTVAGLRTVSDLEQYYRSIGYSPATALRYAKEEVANRKRK